MAQANQGQKPNRKSFIELKVYGPNAQLLDEKDWNGKLNPDMSRRERNKLAKQNNWTITDVFNAEAFEAARKDFRTQSRSMTDQSRKDLFKRVFEEADVKSSPKVEAALRVLLPVIDTENDAKMMKALTTIVTAVDRVMKAEQPKRAGGRNKSNQDDNSGSDDKKSDNKQAETVH